VAPLTPFSLLLPTLAQRHDGKVIAGNCLFSDIVYIREEAAGERTLLSAAAVQHARKML
jgi:hypothetical protein